MKSHMTDTIAAVATGGVVSAIGILRLSGPAAISAADSIFRSNTGMKMSETTSRKLIYGKLLNNEDIVIDYCLCTVSRGPNSYTGEDTVEFHCHGSPIVLSEGLRTLFKHGVRQARAGEFTKRAFLNGRMDLSQSEAVIDLIEAETQVAAINAAGQLGGAIGRKISTLYDALVEISAHFFAVIDYPDEDIEEFQLRRYASVLTEAEASLEQLLGTFERGRIMKDGVKTAIIGRPNVGKSSLLNALLGYDRAIVTTFAGTTRDTIEESLHVGDVLLRLIDTAGIREADDDIEKLGIARTLEAARGASLVLAVFDGNAPLTEDDHDVIQTAQKAPNSIAVINKSDLGTIIDEAAVQDCFDHVYMVSSRTGEGLDTLSVGISGLFVESKIVPTGEILTNIRQAEAIENALESIRQARTALNAGVTPDAVLTEIETALSALGEITGKTIREDITARIFERFCVGK